MEVRREREKLTSIYNSKIHVNAKPIERKTQGIETTSSKHGQYTRLNGIGVCLSGVMIDKMTYNSKSCRFQSITMSTRACRISALVTAQ